MSQRHLADSAGVNPSVVNRAERGGDALLSTWERLFDGLGDRLEFDSCRTSEEAEELLMDEGDARRERQFGRR